MSNVEKVRRIVKGVMASNDAVFKELISQTLLISSPVMGFIQEQDSPSKTLIEILEYWKRAFPGVKSRWVSINEIAEGTVIIDWEATAQHTGDDFMGVPARGVAFKYSGTTTYSFTDGKLTQYSAEVDLEKIKQQLEK